MFASIYFVLDKLLIEKMWKRFYTLLWLGKKLFSSTSIIMRWSLEAKISLEILLKLSGWTIDSHLRSNFTI